MFLWIVVWGVVFGTLAGLVTNSKGRGWGEGIALGGLLGIFGLIIVAFFKPITTPLERPTTSGCCRGDPHRDRGPAVASPR